MDTVHSSRFMKRNKNQFQTTTKENLELEIEGSKLKVVEIFQGGEGASPKSGSD